MDEFRNTLRVALARATHFVLHQANGRVQANCQRLGNEFLEPSHPNIVYSDFVAHGDNAGNKGVRQLPISSAAIIVPIHGDPTGANYGQLRSMPRMVSSAMPTSGRYCYGHFVRKSYPATAGSAGAQYMVTGWWRVSTGDGHALGADWVEARALTGA